MKKNIIKLTILPLALSLAACSSSEKKEDAELNAKVKAEAPASSPEQIMMRASLAFSNAEGLSTDQKDKLAEIYRRVYTDSMQIRREIGQSKSLLFSTLAKPSYKTSEITALKTKIVSLDQKRLNIMFTALDDVQAVVGKGTDASKIYKHFQDYEFPREVRDYNY